MYKLVHDYNLGNGSTLEVNDALTPQFSLQKQDKARVYELCGQIRKIILAEPSFDEPHKRRLLNRIAAVEKEVGKEKGRFDTILAGIVDFGETAGKFGKDIKPLTDRYREVREITQAGTKEYDQIPAPEEIKRIEDQTSDD